MKNTYPTIFVLAILLLFSYCSPKAGKKESKQETSYTTELMSSITKTDTVAMETKINTLKQALDAYYLDNDEYPETLDMLLPTYTNAPSMLEDPWGTRFKLVTDEEMNLVLVSAGKDREFGSQDDIKRRI